MLFDLVVLGILSLRLALHLIAHQPTAQRAEPATDQRAFARVVVTDRAANERTGTGAERATTEGAFFAGSQRRGTPTQQGNEA